MPTKKRSAVNVVKRNLWITKIPSNSDEMESVLAKLLDELEKLSKRSDKVPQVISDLSKLKGKLQTILGVSNLTIEQMGRIRKMMLQVIAIQNDLWEQARMERDNLYRQGQLDELQRFIQSVDQDLRVQRQFVEQVLKALKEVAEELKKEIAQLRQQIQELTERIKKAQEEIEDLENQRAAVREEHREHRKQFARDVAIAIGNIFKEYGITTAGLTTEVVLDYLAQCEESEGIHDVDDLSKLNTERFATKFGTMVGRQVAAAVESIPNLQQRRDAIKRAKDALSKQVFALTIDYNNTGRKSKALESRITNLKSLVEGMKQEVKDLDLQLKGKSEILSAGEASASTITSSQKEVNEKQNNLTAHSPQDQLEQEGNRHEKG